MDLQLQGKKAFVSGSTQGIGFAIARHLLTEGAAVVINGRSEQKVQEAAGKLKNTLASTLSIPPDAVPVSGIAADFGQASDVENLIRQLGPVDILVNNAGIFEPKPFTAITDGDWTRFFEINVLSGIRLSRMQLPGMLERNWGRILFISSESAIHIPEEMIHYGMTKTAQLAISRGLAELTKGTGVTVNSVLPGPTMSEGVDEFVRQLAQSKQVSEKEVESDFFRNMRPTSLLQRFASTDEIANMVTYLCSPLASATNGAAVRVDGGVVRSIV